MFLSNIQKKHYYLYYIPKGHCDDDNSDNDDEAKKKVLVNWHFKKLHILMTFGFLCIEAMWVNKVCRIRWADVSPWVKTVIYSYPLKKNEASKWLIHWYPDELWCDCMIIWLTLVFNPGRDKS